MGGPGWCPNPRPGGDASGHRPGMATWRDCTRGDSVVTTAPLYDHTGGPGRTPEKPTTARRGLPWNKFKGGTYPGRGWMARRVDMNREGRRVWTVGTSRAWRGWGDGMFMAIDFYPGPASGHGGALTCVVRGGAAPWPRVDGPAWWHEPGWPEGSSR